MELFGDKQIDEVYVQRINIRWRWDGKDKVYIVYMNPFSGNINILNPVGADVFNLCDGKHTISEIIDAIIGMYEGASRERITDDVIDLLRYFKREELVQVFS